jgi:hypothetical protein
MTCFCLILADLFRPHYFTEALPLIDFRSCLYVSRLVECAVLTPLLQRVGEVRIAPSIVVNVQKISYQALDAAFENKGTPSPSYFHSRVLLNWYHLS